MNISIFFFFQAEDGIRDIGVTGIQTCALPICRLLRNYRFLSYCSTIFLTISPPTDPHSLEVKLPLYSVKFTPNSFEIGRASCRERGVDLGGRRIIKKKNMYKPYWSCESVI